ncbi:MAG: hypothetical protein ACYC33_10950 [Thermoleophilia bacterium]
MSRAGKKVGHVVSDARIVHRELAAGRWRDFSLVEQMANVGSEVERALGWACRDNREFSGRALERGLELLGLTIADPRHRHRLKELTRVRETLLDYFLGDNQYASTADAWHSYFHAFGVAAAIRRECAARGE